MTKVERIKNGRMYVEKSCEELGIINNRLMELVGQSAFIESECPLDRAIESNWRDAVNLLRVAEEKLCTIYKLTQK